MAEWAGHSRLSFPDKPVISRSQGCKDMIIGVAVWLPEKQQQKTQSGCNCFLSSFSLQQLWERQRQTGDGWPCKGCSPVSCLRSRVMCRVQDLGSSAAPSASRGSGDPVPKEKLWVSLSWPTWACGNSQRYKLFNHWLGKRLLRSGTKKQLHSSASALPHLFSSLESCQRFSGVSGLSALVTGNFLE